MLSNGENISSVTQVFDTMAERTMLSPAHPEKTDVQSLPLVQHPAPTGLAQSHPRIKERQLPEH